MIDAGFKLHSQAENDSAFVDVDGCTERHEPRVLDNVRMSRNETANATGPSASFSTSACWDRNERKKPLIFFGRFGRLALGTAPFVWNFPVSDIPEAQRDIGSTLISTFCSSPQWQHTTILLLQYYSLLQLQTVDTHFLSASPDPTSAPSDRLKVPPVRHPSTTWIQPNFIPNSTTIYSSVWIAFSATDPLLHLFPPRVSPRRGMLPRATDSPRRCSSMFGR